MPHFVSKILFENFLFKKMLTQNKNTYEYSFSYSYSYLYIFIYHICAKFCTKKKRLNTSQEPPPPTHESDLQNPCSRGSLQTALTFPWDGHGRYLISCRRYFNPVLPPTQLNNHRWMRTQNFSSEPSSAKDTSVSRMSSKLPFLLEDVEVG